MIAKKVSETGLNSVGYSKDIFLTPPTGIPFPPFPAISFHAKVILEAGVNFCCDQKDAKVKAYLSGSVRLDLYGSVGLGQRTWRDKAFPPGEKRGRNDRMADPRPGHGGEQIKRKKLAPQLRHPETGEGFKAVFDNQLPPCPEKWEFIDWSLHAYVRGSAGFYWGYQFNLENSFKNPKDLFDAEKWNLTHGVGTGIYGVTAEFGVGGSVSLTSPALTLGNPASMTCCRPN